MTVPERPELQKSGGSVTRPDREHMSADAGEERDVERVARDLWCADRFGIESDSPDQVRRRHLLWDRHHDEDRQGDDENGTRYTITGRDHWRMLARAAITAYTSCEGRDLFREGVEAAAKVCESQHYLSDGYEIWAALEKTATAIRALSRK